MCFLPIWPLNPNKTITLWHIFTIIAIAYILKGAMLSYFVDRYYVQIWIHTKNYYFLLSLSHASFTSSSPIYSVTSQFTGWNVKTNSHGSDSYVTNTGWWHLQMYQEEKRKSFNFTYAQFDNQQQWDKWILLEEKCLYWYITTIPFPGALP